jgi:hypothetical protein
MTAAGRGFVDGDTLLVYFHTGGCGWFVRSGYDDGYTYDGGSDTLLDNAGITWYRT